MDLTFSYTSTTWCVNVSSIFNADMTAMPFNVNLTTTEAPIVVSLNPAFTTVTILDGNYGSYHGVEISGMAVQKK